MRKNTIIYYLINHSLTIDCQLKWEEEIISKFNRTKYLIHVVFRVSRILSTEAIRIVV